MPTSRAGLTCGLLALGLTTATLAQDAIPDFDGELLDFDCIDRERP